MNRRNFLQCLGAFAAAAFLPACSERIIRAPVWAKEVIVYRTAVPLTAGSYTFSAYAGDLGIYIGGFKAIGGERLFEIPVANHPMENPRIKLGGISVKASIDFTDVKTRNTLLRGSAVTKT